MIANTYRIYWNWFSIFLFSVVSVINSLPATFVLALSRQFCRPRVELLTRLTAGVSSRPSWLWRALRHFTYVRVNCRKPTGRPHCERQFQLPRRLSSCSVQKTGVLPARGYCVSSGEVTAGNAISSQLVWTALGLHLFTSSSPINFIDTVLSLLLL